MNIKCFYWIALLLFIGCVPSKEEKLTEINLSLEDPIYQKIYNYQDQQLTDSLINYFRHPDPTYRYLSALAFGSVKDKAALSELYALLEDDIPEVQTAAAYAIGQIGEESSEDILIQAFERNDSLSKNLAFSKAILEAVGKSSSIKYLKPLSTVSTYLRTDTLLLEGQAWGIYAYALRKMVVPEGTERMVSFLTKIGYPQSVRLIAANYLYRAPNVQLDSFATTSLLRVVRTEASPYVKMTLAIALGKTKSETGLNALKEMYAKEGDYRVKCNIIRALANFDYLKMKDVVLTAIDDPNIHVASTAAQFLVDFGSKQDAVNYWRKAKQDVNLPWQVNTLLFKAANRLIPPYFSATKGNINAEIKKRILSSKNEYEKAALLSALSEFGWNYKFIKEEAFGAESNVVRSSGVKSLGDIVRNPKFRSFFGLGARRVKRDITTSLQEAISSKDVGMIVEASKIFRDESLEFKNEVDSIDFMDIALEELKPKRDLEAYQELKETINFFNGATTTEKTIPAYNREIDWENVTDITPEVEAKIQTSYGTITLDLLTEQTPATVANFVQLAKNGFYDNKKFHRVVSNFVVQSGCPRGDGYGSLDYTIRSELPPLYYDDEGYVGMASAGNHTECTQWFITHSPTPHLNGNYTIFAKVKNGMDVVHKLMVGDEVQKITITR